MGVKRNTRSPQRAMNIWLLATMVLFYFGPLNYNCEKELSMLYMLFFLVVANFFYFLGCHQKIFLPRKKRFFSLFKIIQVTLTYSFVMTVLLFFETAFIYGFKSFSLFEIISQMANTYTNREDYQFFFTAWILSYTQWIRVIALVLGSLHWNVLKNHQKLMYVVMCVIIVVYNTLYVGSQIALITLLIYIIVPKLMIWIKDNRALGFNKSILIVSIVVLFSVFLGSVIAGRRALWASLYSSNASIATDPNNWIYILLPNVIADPITYLISYITQGYRGLSLCLTLPFEWTYGLGSSFKLMNDVSRWLSIPVDSFGLSYPVRMQATYGIGAYAAWHTIFPWIASDFTFLGAIFVVSIFIYYWSKSWSEYLSTNNWIASVMFSQLSVLVLFIPCNNQLFQTRDSIVASIVIFILWYFYHGVENKRIYDLKGESYII